MKTKVIVKHGFYEVWQDGSLIAGGHSLGYSPAKVAELHGFNPRRVELVGEAVDHAIHPIFADILAVHGITK